MNRNWTDLESIYSNLPGARHAFEEICEMLFRADYPNDRVEIVNARIGDGGIDIFVGEYGMSPITVFQCKFFLSPLEETQKGQIRRSFNKVMKATSFKVDKWVLCLPRTLEPNEHLWFSKWKEKKLKEHDKKNEFINVITGNRLIDLLKNHNLYNRAFKINDSIKIEELHDKALNKVSHQELSDYKTVLSEKLNTQEFHIPRTLVKFENTVLDHSTYRPDSKKHSLKMAIPSNRLIALLGDAGSGKSTELQNVISHILNTDPSITPVLKKLNIYTPEEGIDNFLPEIWKGVSPKSLLIVLDGLDEANDYMKVVGQINSFVEKHPQVTMVVSSRANFYEIPNKYNSGTLHNFEVFQLEKLTFDNAIHYFSVKFNEKNAQQFVKEVYRHNYKELLGNPFYLNILAGVFEERKALPASKAELFQAFINQRILLDQAHFKNAFELRSRKADIFKLLQRVALSMELMSQNHINEDDLLEVVSSQEYRLLKYAATFKRMFGKEDFWQFEHNNIQEYLAALALSKLGFKDILQIVTLGDRYKKIIPSWSNVISFLFSILPKEDSLFNTLLNWIIKHQKELLVTFETDRVPEETRVVVFKSIFNHYKSNNIRIRRKYDEIKLAKFGQSEESIGFLLNELKSPTNTSFALINAICIIGHFKHLTDDVEKCLTQKVVDFDSDPYFISETIYALEHGGFTSKKTIDKLFKAIGHRKNQYVRSAMYFILKDSDTLESHISYLLEGIHLIEALLDVHDRTESNLMDETWNLNQCLVRLKSPGPIIELLKHIKKSDNLKYLNGYDNALELITLNAVCAYNLDASIYDEYLSLLIHNTFFHEDDLKQIVLIFFIKTKTREQAFWDVLYNPTLAAYIKNAETARLITNSLLEQIIVKHEKGEIDAPQIENLYYSLAQTKNTKVHDALRAINNKKNIFIIPQPIDSEEQNRKRLQRDLDILLDPSSFECDVLDLFAQHNTEEFLGYEKLYNIAGKDRENVYSNESLQFVRQFVRIKKATKDHILAWMNTPSNIELYTIKRIYRLLKDNVDISISQQLTDHIKAWCAKSISSVNFKTAIKITQEEPENFTINKMAEIIWWFSNKFKIEYEKTIYLDMLSFCWGDINDPDIGYLVTKLSKGDIANRMMFNMRNELLPSFILKSYILFLSENKVSASYDLIANEIFSKKRGSYRKVEFLDVFFKNTKDTFEIKKNIYNAQADILFPSLNILKDNGDSLFVEEFLISYLGQQESEDLQLLAACMLMSLDNILGLKEYVRIMNGYQSENIQPHLASDLTSLRSLDAIPFLVELLQKDKENPKKIDDFYSYSSNIIQAIGNIALSNEDNFFIVREKLVEIASKNNMLDDTVQHVLNNLEELEDQFYTKISKPLTIEDVRKKLSELSM